MVSKETIAFVTASCRGVAACVPHSLEQPKGCERRASLWYLFVLLLFRWLPSQLEARASVWCIVVCFLLVVLLAVLIVDHCCEVGFAASRTMLHRSRTRLVWSVWTKFIKA